MEIQQDIGADIIMAFDQCAPYPCDYDTAKKLWNVLTDGLKDVLKPKLIQDRLYSR